MKKNIQKIFLIFIAIFSIIFIASCNESNKTEINENYSIKVNNDLNFILHVGEKDIDFTKYFIILDENNKQIEVKNEYLDLSHVNLNEEGSFQVTLNYKNKEITINFLVINDDFNHNNQFPSGFPNDNPMDNPHPSGFPSDMPHPTGKIDEIVDLSIVFDKYEDETNANYNLIYEGKCLTDNDYSWSTNYSFSGYNMKASYEFDGDVYTNYLFYKDGKFYFIYNYDVDEYEIYDENDFEIYPGDAKLEYFDLTILNDIEFKVMDDHYEAIDPILAGELILAGDDEIDVYEKISLYVDENNNITKIIGINKYYDDEEDMIYDYIITLTLSDHGNVSLDYEMDQFDFTNTNVPTESPIYVSFDTTFLDVNLGCEKGEFEYYTNGKANSFDNIRGVQFLQNGGTVEIYSYYSVSNVSKISLTLATNADSGMTVKAFIGDNELTPSISNGLINKTNYDTNVSIDFTSQTPLDGVVLIKLIPNQTSKSMYISEISLLGDISVGEVMPKQEYDPLTFDSFTIRDAYNDIEGAGGLMDSGSYHALVIPVEFKNSVFTEQNLKDLEATFNGTSIDTGYESVSSFYYNSSFGKLDITFDIMAPYQTNRLYSYYENYYDAKNELYGDTLLLLEAMEYYDDEIDYSIYDIDKDGIIDAVYIIYSCPVEYNDSDSIYWAYVTQYIVYEEENNKTFDGLDVYYYLFAGMEFMYEDADNTLGHVISSKLKGLTLNPLTYIHETGHLLGLDDYYDYDEFVGGNRSIGSSFMMDYNYGDHDPYSKTILGWITPNIITDTGIYELNDYETFGDVLLIPLDFNNSYFSEYLLVILYTDNNLNEFFKNQTDYEIFESAEYGIAIFYVSSYLVSSFEEIDEDYYAITKNNNSTTLNALIYLLEADGEYNFDSSDGYTASSDLWYEGDKLSDIYPSLTRNDGKFINFDLEVIELNDGTSKIKITFIN